MTASPTAMHFAIHVLTGIRSEMIDELVGNDVVELDGRTTTLTADEMADAVALAEKWDELDAWRLAVEKAGFPVKSDGSMRLPIPRLDEGATDTYGTERAMQLVRIQSELAAGGDPDAIEKLTIRDADGQSIRAGLKRSTYVTLVGAKYAPYVSGLKTQYRDCIEKLRNVSAGDDVTAIAVPAIPSQAATA